MEGFSRHLGCLQTFISRVIFIKAILQEDEHVFLITNIQFFFIQNYDWCSYSRRPFVLLPKPVPVMLYKLGVMLYIAAGYFSVHPYSTYISYIPWLDTIKVASFCINKYTIIQYKHAKKLYTFKSLYFTKNNTSEPTFVVNKTILIIGLWMYFVGLMLHLVVFLLLSDIFCV